jgi:hypothetical protein
MTDLTPDPMPAVFIKIVHHPHSKIQDDNIIPLQGHHGHIQVDLVEVGINKSPFFKSMIL